MQKKNLWVLAAALFSLSLLAACGGGKTADGDTEELDGDTDTMSVVDGDTVENGEIERDVDATEGDTVEAADEVETDDTYEPYSPGNTWRDPVTGWTWQTSWNDLYDQSSVEEAKLYCKQLKYGNWKLPTIEELRTLIQGCPTNAAGGDCVPTQHDTTCWPNTPRNEAWNTCNAADESDNGCFPVGMPALGGNTDFLSATVQAAKTTGGESVFYFLSRKGCAIYPETNDDAAIFRCVDTTTATK